MDEDSIGPKLLRGLAKTAIVAGCAAGLLWALDQEDVYLNFVLTFLAAYWLWSALFPKESDESRTGAAYVYGADASVTRRPLITFYGHSTEGALALAQQYADARSKLAERCDQFPLRPGGLLVSEVGVGSPGAQLRLAAGLGLLLALAAGVFYFFTNGPWQLAVMTVAMLIICWRWITKRRSGRVYIYRRFTDRPVADVEAYSQQRAWDLAWQYIEEFKAMADAGLISASDADLQAMQSGSVKRGSKDWPWQEDTSKK